MLAVVLVITYGASVDDASSGKWILWRSEPHSIYSRDATSESHSRPSVGAIRLIHSSIPGVAKVDNQVDSHDLLDAKCAKPEEEK
jgi:hypothetical protein